MGLLLCMSKPMMLISYFSEVGIFGVCADLLVIALLDVLLSTKNVTIDYDRRRHF